MTEKPSRLTLLLKRIVDEQGSERAAARSLGFAQTTFKQWLKGEPPEYKNVAKLAKALDIPAWQILEMAGISLELPPEPEERIRRQIAIIAANPQLTQILYQLAAIHTDMPDFTEKVAKYLAFELSTQGIPMPSIEEDATSASTLAERKTGGTEDDYIAMVQRVAEEISEQDRQSYVEAIQSVIRRFRKRRPDHGDEPQKRPA